MFVRSIIRALTVGGDCVTVVMSGVELYTVDDGVTDSVTLLSAALLPNMVKGLESGDLGSR